jgi:putative aminopeptidase FrvX
MKIAQGLLECPTAPLMEELTAHHVWEFAGRRRSLFRRQDASGNILVGYPASGMQTSAPLVVMAHLDHPAFHVVEVDGRKVRLRFCGGVGEAHVHKGLGVRFYERGKPGLLGHGRLTSFVTKNGRLIEAEAIVRSGRAAVPGFATWDVPSFRVRGKLMEACACDDVLGCAVLLCVLDELHRKRPLGAGLWVLFTRAEELGFYGALMAARDRLLPRRARVVSLECSRALPNAPQGGGAIVRIGDASSIFDPGLCNVLRNAAEDLGKNQTDFRYRRRLMDGGTCEAFAFGCSGYATAGLALPLGNYHNQAGLDAGRKTIAAESVHADDFLNAIMMILHLAHADRRQWKQWEGEGLKRLSKLARQARTEIAAHPLRIGLTYRP